MANFLFNRAAAGVLNGSINLLTDTLKAMLIDNSYTADRDDDFITASGVGAAEITATNYAGGFAGAGRKTLAGRTVSEDDPNDRAELDANDVPWTALGGAVNDTIQAVVIVKEGTSDADSELIAYIDTSTGTPSLPFTTNGSDFTAVVNAEGLIQLATA